MELPRERPKTGVVQWRIERLRAPLSAFNCALAVLLTAGACTICAAQGIGPGSLQNQIRQLPADEVTQRRH